MSPEEKKEIKRLYDIEYRKKNKLIISSQKKEWIKNNPIKVAESIERNRLNKKISDKNYAQNNKDKTNKIKLKWCLNNPEKNKLAKYNYVKRKMATDPLYKLKENIKNSIRQSFTRKNLSKQNNTTNILGCTINEFKIYLESKFEPWMNWENRGNWDGIPKTTNTAWDIDHIIPLSTAETYDDIIKLNYFSNLQPLCSFTNRFIKRDIY